MNKDVEQAAIIYATKTSMNHKGDKLTSEQTVVDEDRRGAFIEGVRFVQNIHEDLLKRARNEIMSLRGVNEKLNIRVEAIDDMLCLLHGKPGTKTSGGMAPDIVYEIDKAFNNKV